MSNTHPLSLAMMNGSSFTNSESSNNKRTNNDEARTQLIRGRSATKKSRMNSSQSSNPNSSSGYTPNTPSSYAASPVPSTSTATPIEQVWFPGEGGNVKDVGESTVITYVSKHLFHHVKFITNRDIQLVFNFSDPTTICYNVLTNCKSPVQNVDRMEWWNTKANNWVYNQLTGLRNNKMTALKLVFYGKLYDIKQQNTA